MSKKTNIAGIKVLFLKHVVNVAKEWEIKSVKAWYAANCLFPKWFAVELTPAEEKKYNDKIQKEENHRIELLENRHSIVEQLSSKELTFTLKASKNGKVYWWIWEKDIITQIKTKYKISLSKKHIYLPDWHIKKIGETSIYIKLWKDAMAKVKVLISSI